MRIVFALVLVAALACSAYAECNGKTSPNSYVGDVSIEDNVVVLPSTAPAGFIALPEMSLGASYHTFEMDALLTTENGCLFSFGTPGPNYVEASVEGRRLYVRIGAAAPLAASIPVFEVNTWQHVAIAFNNSRRSVEVYLDGLRVIPDPTAQGVTEFVNPLPLAVRSGFIGKCPGKASLAPVSAVDNFFITTSYRTAADVLDTLKQFFPILPENDLVAYFGFNEHEGNAKSLNGRATNNWLEATLGGSASRKARTQVNTNGAMVTDTVCTFSGNVILDAAAGDSVVNIPYYKTAGGGFTNTLDCSATTDAPSFIINQRWDDNGAVIGVSIFSHQEHRWRITPGPYLRVERADWGGWLLLAESIGVIEEDRSTYIVGSNEFQLQIAGQGWVRVTLSSPTSLAYQYSLASKACATAAVRDVCSFKVTDSEKYFFSNIAMNEPMGLVDPTAGVGQLPATLACPVPQYDGYRPDLYCASSRAVGDQRCCSMNRDLSWCPVYYEKCWTPGYVNSDCCSQFKYRRTGDPSSERLGYCPINNNDCWLGQFVSQCCQSDALRIRNGNVLPQCSVSEADCWGWKMYGTARTITDSRCCAYDWNAMRGYRYYNNAVRFPECPIEPRDCWTAPVASIQDPQCCTNSQTRYQGQTRLDFCTPTQEECWRWYTIPNYYRQEDPKCCTQDKKFWKNAAGEKIALPWCSLTNADCWSGLIDARCCASDDLKYFKKADGSLDYTKRLQQCTPTVDDCWGWKTNPTKFPVKVEDQRCCTNDATRYNPNTLERLDYCYPNFKDCWGFYVMGALRDEDQRCCQSYPTLNNERLPYCAPSVPVPPPPPVAPPPPPTLKVDVCVNVTTQDPQKWASIQATCESLYGDRTTVAYKTCVATMCKDGDPGTPPIPDCRVERLLKAANPSYVLPTICESGCPNGCYGRGQCNSGKCQCNVDYTGADCSIPVNFNKCDVSLRSPTSGMSVQCQPFPVTYYNKGVTPMLTRDFTNVTVQYYDMSIRMRDTVTVYMIKTIDDFITRAEQFHLVITNNDGAGFTGGNYVMDIDFKAGSDLSNINYARITQNTDTTVTLPAPGGLRVTVAASWTMAGRTGVVLFNVSRGAAPDFTVKVRDGSNIPQYVMGCQSPSGAFEVMKFTSTEYSTTNGGINVKCSKINAQCNAADCKSCAALPNCGWCVETASCQPGSTSGPFIGQCFNWRYTFDTMINRRLTVIPGYPTNPRQTDVYLTQASTGGGELPIEVSVTAVEQSAVPWDFVMLNEYTAASKSAYVPSGIVNILQTLKELPNSGVAIANLRADATGFNFIKMITNPRDYTGIPDALASADSALMTPATGDLDVLNALYRTCDPNANTFNLRPAARTVILISTARMYKAPASVEFMKALRQRLLDRNAAIVFAVPGSLTSAYEALVAQLTIGRVININADFSNLARVVPVAINRASSSIGLSVGLNADNTVSGHINNAYFQARISTYTIDNVKPPMRAKFWVPVEKTTSTSRTTTLYFPTYGRSIIESVATDLPTSSNSVVEARAGIPTLIELKGMSYRNLYKVAFNVTRLPDPAKGNLFIAVLDSATGAWVKTNSLPNAGKLVTAPTTIPFGRLFFQSEDTTSTGVNFASFDFVVIDGCSESITYTVQMNVVAANVAPVAEMPSPRGLEGTPMLIELGGSDADGDDAVFTLTRGLFDATEGVDRVKYPVGKFCAYEQSWETNAFPSGDCTALVAPVDLTDPRIIYVPPTYGHSFADPTRRPELLLIPCFSYKLTELTTKDNSPLKSSNELDVQIILDHVNQAPFAWYDPMDTVRENVFKFDFVNATNYAVRSTENIYEMDCVPKVGGASCTYQEDFGELYWWNAGYRYIYLGGFDIEGSELTAEITWMSSSCPSGMVLTPHYDDVANIKVGTIIPKLPSGYLTPVLKFRPAKETSSVPGTPYCSFRYRVLDKEGANSIREASVDIHVDNVDKPPRMTQQVMDVVSYELRPKTFPINAEDPEGQAFNGFLVGCTSKKGKLQICRNYPACSDLQTISCENLGQGVQLDATVFKTVSSTQPKWIGVFTSDKLGSISEGHMYETFYFEFRDGSSFVPEKFRVNMNVIKINTAPKIFVANNEGVEQHEASYSAQLPMNTAWSAKFRVEDEDIGFGTMDLNVTLDDSFAATVSFDLAALGRAFEGLSKGLTVQTPTRIEFHGSLAAVNKLLSALSVIMPDARYFPDSGFATAVVKVSVDDNGFTGQCPDATTFSVRTCPLTDATEFTITWAKPQDNNQVTVAASASAAAFAGIAAVAAAILFRKVNRRAEEEYAPWNVDDGDDGVVSNPLYENSGLSGTNPLFEGENGGL